jgi:hypothetical protein
VPALCSLAGNAACRRALLSIMPAALQEIFFACPPGPEVMAACAQGLVRRLQQQQQQQQQQQAPAASTGSIGHPGQLAAALEVLMRSANASGQEAATRAAAEAGAVEALVWLGRMPEAAGRAALSALAGMVAATEPSLRVPEGVVAAGGVEAALAKLREPAQEEEGEEAESGAAVRLLLVLTGFGPSAEEFRRRVLGVGCVTPIVQFFVRAPPIILCYVNREALPVPPPLCKPASDGRAGVGPAQGHQL